MCTRVQYRTGRLRFDNSTLVRGLPISLSPHARTLSDTAEDARPCVLRSLAAVIALAGLLGAAGCGTTGSASTGGTSGGGSGTPGSNPPPTPGVLTPSSSTVSFGNVEVGTSTSQLVTLQNTGSSNVVISSVSVTGAGLSASGGTSVTLTPGNSVTVSVNFSPAAAGAVQGSLSVSSNASNSLVQVAVSGTGFVQVVQHVVNLSWQPSTSTVIGYYVYRGASADSLAKLSTAVDSNTNYADNTVASGQTYVYAVSSVDSSYVESSKSAPITVSIPSQ